MTKRWSWHISCSFHEFMVSLLDFFTSIILLTLAKHLLKLDNFANIINKFTFQVCTHCRINSGEGYLGLDTWVILSSVWATTSQSQTWVTASSVVLHSCTYVGRTSGSTPHVALCYRKVSHLMTVLQWIMGDVMSGQGSIPTLSVLWTEGILWESTEGLSALKWFNLNALCKVRGLLAKVSRIHLTQTPSSVS